MWKLLENEWVRRSSRLESIGAFGSMLWAAMSSLWKLTERFGQIAWPEAILLGLATALAVLLVMAACAAAWRLLRPLPGVAWAGPPKFVGAQPSPIHQAADLNSVTRAYAFSQIRLLCRSALDPASEEIRSLNRAILLPLDIQHPDLVEPVLSPYRELVVSLTNTPRQRLHQILNSGAATEQDGDLRKAGCFAGMMAATRVLGDF